MRGGVKIEREDMSAQELRRLAGRVKDRRVSRRLLAMVLVLEGESRKVAAESCGMDRQTLRDWIHRYNAEGVEGLGNRRGGGVKLRLTPDQMAQLATWVEDGPDLERDGVERWRREDLARRIEKVFGIKLHERTVGTYLARQGFRRMSVRPVHPKADPQAQAAFKEDFAALVKPGEGKAFGDMVPGRGKGWSTRDADPHPGKARDTPVRPSRYKWSYIFGAACPGRGTAAGLILPCVNTEAMELHLAEIARTVATDAYALLIVDGAGWHDAKDPRVPDNITLLKLPPYAPELNPWKTSGNTCAPTNSPSLYSTPMTRSSTNAPTLELLCQ